MVLESPSESTPVPDQESVSGLANGPAIETDPLMCPADVSEWPQPIPADSDGPDAEPEVDPTDEFVLTLAQRYLKHQQEANHLFLYHAE